MKNYLMISLTIIKKTIFKRPIFNVIKKIIDLTVRNYPPSDRRIELENKNYIEKLLSQS